MVSKPEKFLSLLVGSLQIVEDIEGSKEGSFHWPVYLSADVNKCMVYNVSYKCLIYF